MKDIVHARRWRLRRRGKGMCPFKSFFYFSEGKTYGCSLRASLSLDGRRPPPRSRVPSFGLEQSIGFLRKPIGDKIYRRSDLGGNNRKLASRRSVEDIDRCFYSHCIARGSGVILPAEPGFPRSLDPRNGVE